METTDRKTVLVLTDFSKNATCAAEGGLVLSGKLKADLLLFNTCIDYATLPSSGWDGWQIEEFSEKEDTSRHELKLLMEGLEALANKLPAEDRRPEIHFTSSEGDLGLTVADIIEQHNIELVIMGARGHSTADALYGYDTDEVIKESRRPVLLMVAGTDLNQIRKLIFATDFEMANIEAIKYMVGLANVFNYQLEIIHVSDGNKEKNIVNKKQEAFEIELAKIKYNGLTYKNVTGENVVSTLNRLGSETNASVLAMLHREHSFFARIFTHSEIKEALSKQKLPLLIFPKEMN